MLSIRIVSASMVAVITVVLAMSGASARAVTSDPSEKPLPLLAGLNPPHHSNAQSKAAGHARKIAARPSKKHIRVAAIQAPKPNTRTVAPPAEGWPAPLAIVPADAAIAAPPENSAPDIASAPSEVVLGGQTVQVAAPDQVNAIDLAAGDDVPAVAPADRADAASVAQTVLAAPAAHADVAQNADTVGSASWIAQVLAALGGAAAAGAVAWFLIGSGPVRIYG